MRYKKEEKLKKKLFEIGYKAIIEVLGYDYPLHEDQKVTDNRLDVAFEQLTDLQLDALYSRYCIIPEVQATAYALYQLDWMMQRGYGIYDFILNIQEEWETTHEEYGDDAEDMPIQLYESMKGFYSHDESWVCFNEFLETEYMNKDYMLKLLSIPMNSKELLQAYLEDIGSPKKIVYATNIKWDTDGVSIDDLPEEVEIPGDTCVEDIADYLSDSYGWCVESFNIEVK